MFLGCCESMLEIGLLDLNQELACMLKFARVCESGERGE